MLKMRIFMLKNAWICLNFMTKNPWICLYLVSHFRYGPWNGLFCRYPLFIGFISFPPQSKAIYRSCATCSCYLIYLKSENIPKPWKSVEFWIDFGILAVLYESYPSKYSVEPFHFFHKARPYIGSVRREVIFFSWKMKTCQNYGIMNGLFNSLVRAISQ